MGRLNSAKWKGMLAAATGLVLLAGFRGLPELAHAQISLGQLTDFTFPTTDTEGRKTVIKGEGAKTTAEGMVELTGMTAQLFRDEQPDMTIEAPHCLFNTRTRVAASGGELSVRTADQRFAIRGQGFRWQMSHSHLVISNQVQARVRRGILTGAAQTPQDVPAATNQTGLVEIESDRFELAGGTAWFRGNVRAKQANGNLSCDALTAYFGEEGTRLDRIEAAGNVSFQQGDVRASGARAVYTVADDIVRLSGNVSWKAGEREGTGGLVILKNDGREFRIEQGAVVRLLPNQMLPLDWFGNGGAAPANPEPITISSDVLETTPALALFRGNVQVSDAQGGALTCSVLTNILDEAGGKIAKVIAAGNVELRKANTRAASDQAVYDAASGEVTLMGNPRWKFAQGEGKSDRLKIFPDSQRIEADRNVVMKLFVSDSFVDLPKPDTSPPENSATNRTVQIVSDELYYKPGSAIFLDSVRVLDPDDPAREMTCEVLAAFFAGTDNKLDQLIAEENLVIRQEDMKATGTKAVYTLPEGTIELFGDGDQHRPEIRMPKRKYVADRFILNRASQVFRMIGRYRIEMEQSAARAEFSPP